MVLACFGINSFFGSNEYQEPATISPEETIRNLRNHILQQEKRERYLEHKLTVLAKEAKEKLAKGDKKGAVSLMKKRKLYQNEVTKIGNIKMTLETQAIHLESAAFTADAFQAMTVGNNYMKKIRTHMGGVDAVDNVMMDMQEEMQMVEEVNTAIGQSVDGGILCNEEDLMKELEEMDRMDLEERFVRAETGETRLSAKNNQAPSTGLSNREEEDLRLLQAELAM